MSSNLDSQEPLSTEVLGLDTEAPLTDVMEQAIAPYRLPFSFASRFGVLVSEDQGRLILSIKPDTTLDSLAEVRRFLGRPFTIRRIDDAEFEALLEVAYQRDTSETQQLINL